MCHVQDYAFFGVRKNSHEMIWGWKHFAIPTGGFGLDEIKMRDKIKGNLYNIFYSLK